MSIKVTLPAAFTRHTDGRKQFDSAAGNLPGLLADIDQTFARRYRLFASGGTIHQDRQFGAALWQTTLSGGFMVLF